jgi:hypothetical protein
MLVGAVLSEIHGMRRPLPLAEASTCIRLAAATIGLAAALLAGQAAAMMLPASLEQASNAADLIARGKVTKAESHWTRDRSAIYTDVTVAVDRTVKSRLSSFNKNVLAATRSAPARLVFRVAGGVVGDIAMTSSDVELPQTGDDLVVFLNGRGALEEAAGLDVEPDTLTPTLVASGPGWLPIRSGRVEFDGRTVSAEDFLASVAEMVK